MQVTPIFLISFIPQPLHHPRQNRFIPTTSPPIPPPLMAIQSLPEIYISPPPPSEHFVEPFSPFDNVKFTVEEDEKSYRPTLLSPPPGCLASIPRHLSPLSPKDAPVRGQGLERERFEKLLQSSRERSAALGYKKAPDLRKELALKTYKSKQSTISPPPPPFLVRAPR